MCSIFCLWQKTHTICSCFFSSIFFCQWNRLSVDAIWPLTRFNTISNGVNTQFNHARIEMRGKTITLNFSFRFKRFENKFIVRRIIKIFHPKMKETKPTRTQWIYNAISFANAIAIIARDFIWQNFIFVLLSKCTKWKEK